MKACMKKVPMIMWFVTGYGVVGCSVVASVSLHAARRRQQKGCTEDEKADEMYACLGTGLGTVLFSLLSQQFQNSSGTTKLVVMVQNETEQITLYKGKVLEQSEWF